MSGHSKWATIHRQKETTDQKRGQAFTKIGNAITMAVKEMGGATDPENNFKLRLAIEKGRAINMPKENIQRAIDRATGKGEGNAIEEVTYEGYGPGGVGIIVETTTDNKQRTVQEVKNIFDRAGGAVASPGSVSFNFKKVGLLIVGSIGNIEDAELKIIDMGAEDVEEANGKLAIYVKPEELMSFKEKLGSEGFNIESVEMELKPINLIPISDKKIGDQIISLLEKLESLDDVQKVSANFDICFV